MKTRRRLKFFKMRMEILKDESLGPVYYEISKKEFEQLEKAMIKAHQFGEDISRDLKERNKLNKMLSSEEPYDVEYYDFFDRYKEAL